MKTDRKMSGFKRIASLFLALMIVLSLVPLQSLHVHAADEPYLIITNRMPEENEVFDSEDEVLTFTEGDAIYVTASDDGTDAWVGLYDMNYPSTSGFFYYVNKEGQESGKTYMAYDYPNGSGWKDWLIVEGEHKVRLYGDYDGTELLDEKTITIVKPAANYEKVLEVKEDTISFGESFKVKAVNYSSGAWVGLYPAEVTDYSTGSTAYYNCVNRNNGVVDLAPTKAGEWQIVLFNDGGYTNVEKKIEVTVEDAVVDAIETDADTYAYSADMKINVSVAPMYQGDDYWVGVYKEGEDPNGTNPNGKYITSIFYSYTKAQPFNVAFVNDQRLSEFVAGNFDVVLLSGETAGSYTIIDKVTITVTAEIDASKTVKTDPTCTEHGEIIYTYTDGTTKTVTYPEDESLKALGHDFEYTPKYTVGQPGNKDRDYKHIGVCKNNEDHTEEANCTWDEETTAGDGYTTYTCTVCEGTVNDPGREIDESKTVVVPPTCTAKGYTVITYADNGETETIDEVDPLGHDFEGVAWDETGDGYHTRTCKRTDCDLGEGYEQTAKCVSESVDVVDGENALKFVCDDCGYDWTETLFWMDKDEFHPGENIYIHVNAVYPYAKDYEWVGLYEKNEKYAGEGSVQSIYWYSVSEVPIKADITTVHANRPSDFVVGKTYTIRLFGDTGYTNVIASVDFDYKDHTYDQKVEEEKYLVSGSVATCKESASYYYSCVCGEKGTETFFSDVKNAENHANPASEWDVDDQIHQKVWTCCLTPDGEAAPHGGWENGKCGDCGYACTHKDTAPKDHICDICTTAGLGEHKQAAGKHTCGYCNAEMSKCSDGNSDHKCDVCKAELSKCADGNSDHKCDVCKAELSKCADGNSDHKCDVCKAELSKCADGNSDHKCDVCKAELSKCADNNSDHKCDVCKAELSKCADANSDHKCDTCKAELSKCADANKDYKCDVCGKELEKPEEPKDEEPKDEEPKEEEPAPEDPKEEEPEEKPEEPTVNQPVGVGRLAGNTRYDTAFQAADELKKVTGKTMFDAVIVSSGEQFADALAGSYLAAVKGAPILLMKDRNKEINAVKEYIKANVNPGGTVYLLGGVNAVPAKMETGLEGFNVKRLGGNDRYATNLQILEEAGVAGKDVVVCTGKDFADSLSASAVGLPILLVKDKLNDKQLQFMAGCTGKIYVIGGVNAVSARVESQLKSFGNVERLAGNTRYDTSALVAKTFFSNPTSLVLAYGKNFPDGLSGGPVAFAMGAPLILTEAGKEKVAAAYVAETGIQNGYVQGGTAVLPEKTVNKVFGK